MAVMAKLNGFESRGIVRMYSPRRENPFGAARISSTEGSRERKAVPDCLFITSFLSFIFLFLFLLLDFGFEGDAGGAVGDGNVGVSFGFLGKIDKKLNPL